MKMANFIKKTNSNKSILFKLHKIYDIYMKYYLINKFSMVSILLYTQI